MEGVLERREFYGGSLRTEGILERREFKNNGSLRMEGV